MAAADERLDVEFEEGRVEEDSSFEEDDLGIAPYLFEPETDEQPTVEDENSPPPPVDDSRLGNTSWLVDSVLTGIYARKHP